MRHPLDDAYVHLPAHVAGLYRQLGVCPLDWVDSWTLAVLTDLPADAADQFARALSDAGLLEVNQRGYTLNQKQRLHARSRAQDHAGEEVLTAGIDRLFDHFLAVAAAAERIVTPFHRPLWPGHPAAASVVLPFTEDEAAALDWLEVQLPNYMAIIHYAFLDGRFALVCQLAHRLWPLWLRRHPGQRYEAQILGLAAAVALHNDHAYGQMLTSLAGTVRGSRPHEAHEFNLRAVAHYRDGDDGPGLAYALNALGEDLLAGDELDQADTFFRQAEQLRTQIGDERGAALSRQGRALVILARGDAHTAAGYLDATYQTLTRIGDTYCAALTLAHHAQAITATGALDRGLQELDQALAATRKATSAFGQATVQKIRGDVLRAAGRIAEARAAYAQAQKLSGVDPVS